MMKEELKKTVLVDADACPVKEIIIRIAKEFQYPVVFFIDTSHVLEDSYAEVVNIGKGGDAVDFTIVNRVREGDIVVTQDYGLAAMVLSKGARAIHPGGLIYTDENLDRLLMVRHVNAKIRRAGGRHAGAKKRMSSDDIRFEQAFRSLCASDR